MSVSNMNCAACPITLRKALEGVPGVKGARVDFKSRTAVVDFDAAAVTPDRLIKATTNAGYPSKLMDAKP